MHVSALQQHTHLARLQNEAGEPAFNVSFYALNKAGEVAGARIRGKGRMAVADANGARHIDMAYLYA